MSRLLPLFLAAPVLLAAAPAHPAPKAARQAPHAEWQTFRTKHYRIHCPPGLMDWGREIASRIEGFHDAITPLVGYASPRPVQILLLDPRQEANGMAVPILDQPFVRLWATLPESDDTHAGSMTSWTEDVTVHELTHIHHLMRPQNHPSAWERLMGVPVGPLPQKAPRWVMEGYATLVEGKLTGSGRPHSSTRAAILRQWALQGKLPEYGALDAGGGFLGGNMAYMVGSAYLEWLERQRPQTPDVLVRLWKQIASRKRRDFPAAFRASFGFDPKDGYDRFRAELNHDALAWERALKAEGLREGEAFARFPGKVGDLSVAPGGKKLLARCANKLSDSGLVVWDLEAKAPEKSAQQKAEEARDARDPNEVPDVDPEFPKRKAVRLPAWKGRIPERPLWVDDRSIRFELKRADEEGVLTRQPALWRSGQGVDLHPGPIPVAAEVLYPVHRAGAWELSFKGRKLPLPGQAIGRAWVDAPHGLIYAGCELDGTWNLVRVPFQMKEGQPEFGEAERLTRTASAVWNPAPSPDGKRLYFTRLDARGTEIRVMALDGKPLAAGKAPAPEFLTQRTVLPPPLDPNPLPGPVASPPAEPYRALDNQWIRSMAGFSFLPQGSAYQFGVGGNDLLNRFSWMALAGFGDGAGPRGGMLGFSSTAWRWNPSLMAFSALERPSRQRFSPRAEDRERRGFEFSVIREDKGELPWWVAGVLADERVQRLQEQDPLGEATNRRVAALRGGAVHRFGWGEWGLSTRLDGSLLAGRNRQAGTNEGWDLERGSLSFSFRNPAAPLVARAEAGRIGGRAGEQFHLGGLTGSLVPPTLDLNRVEQLALPTYEASGDRFLRYRGELGAGLRAYLEHTALWSATGARGPFQKVVGLEFAAGPEMIQGAESVLGKFQLNLGVHRPLNGLQKDRTVVTFALVIRP